MAKVTNIPIGSKLGETPVSQGWGSHFSSHICPGHTAAEVQPAYIPDRHRKRPVGASPTSYFHGISPHALSQVSHGRPMHSNFKVGRVIAVDQVVGREGTHVLTVNIGTGFPDAGPPARCDHGRTHGCSAKHGAAVLCTVVTNAFNRTGSAEAVLRQIGARFVVVAVTGQDVDSIPNPQGELQYTVPLNHVIVEQPVFHEPNAGQLRGQLCDNAMLGWANSPSWAPVLLPSYFNPGDAPPDTMPLGTAKMRNPFAGSAGKESIQMGAAPRALPPATSPE